MQPIHAELSISMSEFKKNPAQVLRGAGQQPVAVLSHNKPAFYMVSPELFASMLEALDTQKLVALTRQRLKRVNKAVEVDIDQL